MRLDKYKKIRWIVLSFLAVAIFLPFTGVDQNWSVVLIVIALLIGANAIDKKQKEYLNEKIGELEKRIDKLEHK